MIVGAGARPHRYVRNSVCNSARVAFGKNASVRRILPSAGSARRTR